MLSGIGTDDPGVAHRDAELAEGGERFAGERLAPRGIAIANIETRSVGT